MRAGWITALIAAAFVCGVRPVAAQPGGAGFLFVAPGQTRCCGHGETTIHFGGGGDVITGSGIGANVELGYLAATQGLGDGLGAFSADGTYHFGRQRVVPFVMAGYSLFFRDFHENLFNYGGGMTYWSARRVGLRVEIRDHTTTAGRERVHFWGARFGVVFR